MLVASIRIENGLLREHLERLDTSFSFTAGEHKLQMAFGCCDANHSGQMGVQISLILSSPYQSLDLQGVGVIPKQVPTIHAVAQPCKAFACSVRCAMVLEY